MSGAPVCWFVGLTTLDVVHRAATPPGRNQKITATRQDVAAGGPAANAAVTAAALGARAVLITALGQSPVAAAARADLTAHGVEILDVADPGFELAVSAVLVDEGTGERSVVSPDGALAHAPAPTASALAALPRPDAVLFDGHHPEIARAVLAFVAPEGTTAEPGHELQAGSRQPSVVPRRPLVVLDGGRWRPIFADLLPRADVAALSDDFRVPAAADAAAAVLATGAGAVVVTHGPAPIEWHTAGGGSGTVPVPATDARDTLGAGDAFHGALTAALATGKPLPAAITRAAAVATARVAVIGPRTWLSHLDQFRLVVG
jgi:sugar/nucleoside kinase (ribokinase family)